MAGDAYTLATCKEGKWILQYIVLTVMTQSWDRVLWVGQREKGSQFSDIKYQIQVSETWI